MNKQMHTRQTFRYQSFNMRILQSQTSALKIKNFVPFIYSILSKLQTMLHKNSDVSLSLSLPSLLDPLLRSSHFTCDPGRCTLTLDPGIHFPTSHEIGMCHDLSQPHINEMYLICESNITTNFTKFHQIKCVDVYTQCTTQSYYHTTFRLRSSTIFLPPVNEMALVYLRTYILALSCMYRNILCVSDDSPGQS